MKPNSVININTRFFKLITGAECTPDNITQHKDAIRERIAAISKKYSTLVCIVDTAGEDHWFTLEMEPGKPKLHKYKHFEEPAVPDALKEAYDAAFTEADPDGSKYAEVQQQEAEKQEADQPGAARKGRPLQAPEDVQAERFAICKVCEMFNEEKQKCKRCSCGGNGRYERASGRCHLGKWPKFDLQAYMLEQRKAARR